MTAAYNLSQLANKVNSAGQIDVSTALSGIIPTNKLGTGTPSTLTFLRGDQTWSEVTGGQYLGTSAVKAIQYNAQTIAENITIPGTYNAGSFGPITIDSGFTVTVSSGAEWVIV